MAAEQHLADLAAGHASLPPFAREAADVAASQGTDSASGLSAAEAANRLERFGPNQITSEKPPSVWAIALGQFRNPMNIMLVAVVVVTFFSIVFSGTKCVPPSSFPRVHITLSPFSI